MSLHTYLARLEYVDYLISKKATGNVNQLAHKLNLSRSHTLDFLREMKVHGFPIKYSRKIGSYYYTIAGNFVKNLFQEKILFIEEELTDHKMRKILGGEISFPIYPKSDYIRLCDSNFVY